MFNVPSSSPPPKAVRPRTDTRLGYELQLVERRLRLLRIHRSGTVVWLALALLAGALLLVAVFRPPWSSLNLRLLVPAFVTTAAIATWLTWRARATQADATDVVERAHPELGTALRAARQQQVDASGRFHFLQRRVINDVLLHASRHDWARPVRTSARRWGLAHGLALLLALAVSLAVVQRHRPAPGPTEAFAGSFEIQPGHAEVERGSTVIVTARFGEEVPRQATLVWQPEGAAEQRLPMHRSLADPVFAATLPSLGTSGTYRVRHDRAETELYRLSVYDRPALVRSNATLDYPEYTRLPDRTITETRRVSAVAGTRLAFDFIVNQPLNRAHLRAPDGREVPLAPDEGNPLRYTLHSVIAESARFTLHLEDTAGRTNAAPPEIRIEALENRRPEVKLAFPRGDQRVSPVEEMHLQAEVRDDFGLMDYGLAFSVGTASPEFRSVATARDQPTVEAALADVLALEGRQAEPDQLVTWFAWADDIGPDGQVRRTTSDLAFAEVRSLDEIFRENSGGGGGQSPGGGGGPADDLLEVQRQITVAIWKLQSRDSGSPDFETDVTTLHDSQEEALRQLTALRERLDGGRLRQAADAAAGFMEQAAKELELAGGRRSTQPLTPAWTASQGAYQALLRLQPRETDVAQSPQNGQGGSGRRSQNQLNQLQFRHDEDRYATETQAQPPPTPEEREQLQVLARLRELARRQQDLNERLQELQTALAAAEDEARREEIRRELKRLEEEQRRMLADLDETRQRVDQMAPGERTQQARQQLEQTREDMRRAGEQLEQGEVSQALAAGTRARESLQRTGEDLRQEAAGRFGEQMREARRQARELAAEQQAALQELEAMSRGQQSLDDRTQRENLARRLETQAEGRRELLETLRQVTEDSEASEPQLHRQLYDLLRQQEAAGTEQQLTTGAELLRRGFIEPTLEPQAEAARALSELQRGVERAAGAVLGDETNELRFVQRELDALSRDLQRDRANSVAPSGSEATETPDVASGTESAPGGDESLASTETPSGREPPRSVEDVGLAEGARSAEGARAGERTRTAEAAPAPGGPSGSDDGLASLEELAREFGEAGRQADAGRGPLTGGGFGEWSDRLRTVEELLEEPGLRQRLAEARFQAEEMRRGHVREGRAPQWDLVDMGVVQPLQEARTWVRQELNRREQPDALQPVDRDPVPERYAEAVRKYYEALGAD